ncbi:MAG: C-terminal target protein [Bacteroidetes bacterium]|jgi:gliding motility-associated-like protein|nr:C-terminal target protein [Bacteroidota bacterium]
MKKITLIILKIFIVSSVYAQCTAPSFNVNLSAASDTSWILSGTSRAGLCCGSSNCVRFNVTLNSNTDLVNFTVSNPSPSGSAFYQINCGPPISIGTPFCVAGLTSPFTITYCKPGGDRPDFKIIAGSIGKASDDITIRNTGCTDTLFVSNINPATVTWTSIYPGVQGAYNNYLSCTSGCTSTLVTSISQTPPPYIDFQVSGAPNTLSCGTTCKDTVRVYFVNDMNVSISPPSAVTCAAPGTAITMTANPSGGLPPYTYSWSNGANTQSISTSVTGTYTVTVSDKTQCPVKTATKTLAPSPVATFTYTPGSYCKNVGYNPIPTFSGAGTPGTFTATPSGLVFVNANTGEINLAASAPNQYTVTNTVPAAGSCPGSSYSATVYILPVPYMVSPASASVCTGGTVNIPLIANFSSSYTWIANNNPNVSGESLTLQTSATLNNTLINNTGTVQYVTYTVTPTATIYGNCPGTPQIVTVTVNPLDNAGFYYASSTVCNTGTHPNPVITGVTNGSFSGSAGMTINGVNGQINLSSTAVGSYTVTYTTNATCPNSATFPITVTTGPSATFNYPSASYCQNSPNPLPVFPPGSSAGNFSSTSGLVFVSTITGEVNLMASTPGTYIIVNTIAPAGGCSATSATTTITINKYNSPAFNYAGSPYCQNGTNPSPVFTGGGVAGTFTSAAGLSINPATGIINLAASAPGTYTITNTISANGSCSAVSANATVTITALPVTTFSYTGSPYCQNSSNPLPTFSGGGTAGTFTASSLFLEVNPGTGMIDLAASTCDNYYVTNYIPAANGCPAVSTIVPVTITPLPIASFSYTASPYCQNAFDPTPVVSFGGTNGIYTGSPSGLTVEPNSGTLTLSSSTPGNYTVTNTVPAFNGCPAVIATAPVTISPLTPGTFSYPNTPYCKNAMNPLPVFTGGSAAGIFSAPAGLVINSATGEIDLAASTAGTYTVTNTTAPSNGCAGAAYTSTITITPLPVATFSYAGSPYCQNAGTASPAFIGGGAAGVFTSSAGLIINSSTGVIDLASSTAGTYTVTNTIAAANGCPAVTATVNITITTLPVATFSYTGSPYCQNAGTASPALTAGASAGIFSSASGLSINASTGEINLSASTVGTYTVTNTIVAANGCPAVTATASITITPLPTASFNYTGTPYCQNSGTASPTFIGGGYAGIFSSTAGLFINSSTGLVDFTASTAGTYTVTNTIAAANGCPAVTATAPVTITPLPVATFSYTGTPYCQNAGVASPTFTEGSYTGTFSSSTGLSINASTGEVDLSSSAAGTYTVTNTIAAANGCPDVTSTASITVTPLPVATFNYTGSPYCQNAGSASPVFIGGGYAGTFSSTSGLTIDPVTGVVDLALSTAGTYTVTNTIDASNGCPAVFSTTNITITTLPVASFVYTDSPYCQNQANPIPTFTGGGQAGAFSSTSGLSINSVAGTIDLEASTAGTYMVTNTIDASNGCPSVSASTSITITPLPVASFSYSDLFFCQDGSDPLPTLAVGATAGTFSSTNGLSINSSTGRVDLLASTIGTYIITNTIDASNGCPEVAENVSLTINPIAIADAGPDAAICEGNSYALSGTIGGGATSLIWTSNGTGSFDDNTSASATYTPSTADITAGNVVLRLTTNDPAGPCAETWNAMVLTIEPAAIANASSDAVICSGTSYSLTGNIGGGASSLTWTTSGSGTFDNASSSSAVYTPSSNDIAAGIVTLTLTTNDPAGVCPAVSDEMALTINPDAMANAGQDSSICEGSSFALSGVIGGGASSLTWTSSGNGTFDDVNSASAVYTPSASDITNGSVILTITTNDPAGPCNAASDNMTLIIEPAAIADAASDAVICSGSVYTLSGNINGGASSLSWTSNGSGSFDNNASANAVYTPSSADIASGNITLTLTTNDPAGFCSAVSDDMILTINPDATVYAGVDTSICSGNSYKLSGSVGGGASGLIWTSNGSGTFDDNTLASATYFPSPADISAGSVILTVTTNDPAGPCISASDAMTLIINPIPVVNAGQDMTICSGNVFSLNGSIGGGASSAMWSSDGSGSFDNTSAMNANYTPSANDLTNGSVQFTLLTNDPAGACPSVNDIVTLTINPAANINVGADATICAGTEFAVSGTVGGGAGSFVWSSNGSGSFDNINSVNAIYTPSASDVAAGNIILTATTNDPSGPCASVIDEMTLTITPRDNPAFSYTSSTFCETGSDPTPVVTGTAGGVFSSPQSSLNLNASTGTIDLSASALGSYTVYYTTAGSCPDSGFVTVNISNGLSAAFNYTSASYCSNENDPLPVLTQGANSGAFSSTTGLVIDPVSGRINLAASTPGTYTVTNSVAASGGCAQTSSTSVITINQQDNAAFSYAASSFCHSSTNQLPTVTGVQGGAFSCNTSGVVLSSAGEINISASVPGNYPVTYTTNGICPNSSIVNVTINSLPIVEAGDERLIDCGANPINIEVVDSMGNVVNYSWNTNGGNILSGDGTNAASINQTGVYYVVATNTFGCTACDTVIVNESPVVPEASFVASPGELTGVVPFELNFSNTSQNANTYNWNFGDQNGTTVENPNYTFTTAGTYTVTLVASNNGRCADTTDVIVKVEDEFMIPDGFSPNGDGVNDVFVIRGIDRFKGNKFVVFNRWGNQVHEAAPYTNQWDGSTNQDIQLGGNELPVGTYFYVLDLGDGSKPYKGYIYLNK